MLKQKEEKKNAYNFRCFSIPFQSTSYEDWPNVPFEAKIKSAWKKIVAAFNIQQIEIKCNNKNNKCVQGAYIVSTLSMAIYIDQIQDINGQSVLRAKMLYEFGSIWNWFSAWKINEIIFRILFPQFNIYHWSDCRLLSF